MHIKEFFNSDFKEFSNLDNVRSIPSIIDGFKDSQRKAVYGMFRHGTAEIKVAQLAGTASLVSHYNHGEGSMASTIVGLAQRFPGANNINLFEPIGQFGSILSSESSAPRYIYTKPSEWLRKLIRVEDDCLLVHRYEDGEKAEPLNYFPVLPMWLVNGSIGIGTGHSVKILSRSPQDVSKAVSSILETGTCDNLIPCFQGWKGTVTEVGKNQYEMVGVLEKLNTSTIKVTELPVTYSVDKFKSILVDLMEKGKVKDFDNNSTEAGFDFEIKVPREVGRKTEKELISLFKLSTTVTENVTLWDSQGKLKRYDSVVDALCEFVSYKVETVEQRRLKHIEILSTEIDYLEQKSLFIEEWNKLSNPSKMKNSEIEDHMKSAGIREENLSGLFSMKISSLTMDNVNNHLKDIKGKVTRKKQLEKSNAGDMYKEELKCI